MIWCEQYCQAEKVVQRHWKSKSYPPNKARSIQNRWLPNPKMSRFWDTSQLAPVWVRVCTLTPTLVLASWYLKNGSSDEPHHRNLVRLFYVPYVLYICTMQLWSHVVRFSWTFFYFAILAACVANSIGEKCHFVTQRKSVILCRKEGMVCGKLQSLQF